MSIKIENAQVFGWEAAIRGARNPMNSWDKSDSWFLDGKYFNNGAIELIFSNLKSEHRPINPEDFPYDTGYIHAVLGPADHKLLMNLCKGGTEEAKWRRMIHVQMDITAPLYWWKEFDTYKVGTVSDSCSTMHKIHAKEFTLDDFSYEHLLPAGNPKEIPIIAVGFGGNDLKLEEEFVRFSPSSMLDLTISMLNRAREMFLETNDKKYWWQMIQLLPTSYNQKRTIDLNYEVLASQYRQRKGHKLDEWRKYCEWIKTLPYSEFITMAEFVQSKMTVIKPDGAILVSPESLERLWNELGDIPVNDDGIIQESFLWWPKGTDREDIWHWFDEKYPGGVVNLIGNGE